MPSAKFIIDHQIGESFRISKVKSMFDIQFDCLSKEFDIDIPIENFDWNIGLIIGSSGAGKTTIAKKIFSEFNFFNGFEWKNSCILDDFPQKMSANEIISALSSVGFSSPPDWLKPFHLLSNGQKMRAELARLIAEADKPIIYDEFTSVVDRQVAKMGSAAISKFIKKNNKKFIAVSCHYDIEEWLEPDWVYDVNCHKFYRRSVRRPSINIGIRKASQNEWNLFKEFHYLSSEHMSSAHKYIAEIQGVSVGWCSVAHFPHPIVKNMKRIHRIVVRPDYQGIGLGIRFMSEIAKIYKNLGNRITLITGSPAFVYGLQANQNWIMTRAPSKISRVKTNIMKKTCSEDRLTAGFEYKE